MTKKLAILIALGALVIGAVAGGWGVSQFWSRFVDEVYAGSYAAEASTTVGILKRLRVGNTNEAIELLEIKLDGALIGLGLYLPQIPRPQPDPLHLKVVEMARDYRTEFPRTNDSSGIAVEIEKTFIRLTGQSEH